MQTGTHASLHPNCHHQNVFAKFNLKLYYPLPYDREIWYHKKRILTIFENQSMILLVGEGHLLIQMEKVNILNEFIKNVFSNLLYSL